MDSDDEMMVQLFTEERNDEAVQRQQQQLILTSMLRVRQPFFVVHRRGGSKPGKRKNINRHHPEALEATRKEMLATAKKFANTAAAILDEREEAAQIMDRFERQDREITATLEQVKSMRKEWEVKMTYAQAEADRIVREAIPPRRITFATPAEQRPLATPKDNMTKAAELLKKSDEEININYLRTLVSG
ncbi:hypothetical protein QYE76_040113 [Lolium multiflorum]|uniref:Uncharacterized protein n=1 Tax=Lolium multiflorum TaxID=4521 RepID=A0AAD8TAL9_LOLMU|nr:hypothetical protein QYE76_040113 [Lolium multiflorum]